MCLYTGVILCLYGVLMCVNVLRMCFGRCFVVRRLLYVCCMVCVGFVNELRMCCV